MTELQIHVTITGDVPSVTGDHQPCTVPQGTYALIPIKDGFRGEEHVVVLEREDGQRLPPLITSDKNGRTALGHALKLKRAESWDEDAFNTASVYLDAWR